jgi:hypothetical protein
MVYVTLWIKHTGGCMFERRIVTNPGRKCPCTVADFLQRAYYKHAIEIYRGLIYLKKKECSWLAKYLVEIGL